MNPEHQKHLNELKCEYRHAARSETEAYRIYKTAESYLNAVNFNANGLFPIVYALVNCYYVYYAMVNLMHTPNDNSMN